MPLQHHLLPTPLLTRSRMRIPTRSLLSLSLHRTSCSPIRISTIPWPILPPPARLILPLLAASTSLILAPHPQVTSVQGHQAPAATSPKIRCRLARSTSSTPPRHIPAMRRPPAITIITSIRMPALRTRLISTSRLVQIITLRPALPSLLSPTVVV